MTHYDVDYLTLRARLRDDRPDLVALYDENKEAVLGVMRRVAEEMGPAPAPAPAGGTAALVTALVKAKLPELADLLRRRIKAAFEWAVRDSGPLYFRVANGEHGRMYQTTLRHVVDEVRPDGDPRRWKEATLVLNENKLDAYAHKVAAESLDEVVQKLIGKVGELEDATAEGLGAFEFEIKGTRRGGAQRVVIRQQVIVNVSSKGKLFNQYPARIYVDGRPISEAAYKLLGRVDAP